jgi:DNA-binding transcriptional ArsR family regulator
MSRNRHSSGKAPSPGRGTASIFAALGDETRLRIVRSLCASGPLSITRLTAGASVSRQAISKHLRVLADAGLACNSRSGRESVWELDRKPLDEARLRLEEISSQWDAALSRLQTMVESEN